MTEPYYQSGPATIFEGDCIEIMRTLPDASFDAVVTDPPYSLSFMGREWDSWRMGGSRRWFSTTATTDLASILPICALERTKTTWPTVRRRVEWRGSSTRRREPRSSNLRAPDSRVGELPVISRSPTAVLAGS